MTDGGSTIDDIVHRYDQLPSNPGNLRGERNLGSFRQTFGDRACSDRRAGARGSSDVRVAPRGVGN